MNILTLKVGTKYSAEYVNRLYNAIKRNTSIAFNFYCNTEDASGLIDEIRVVELSDPESFKLQWHKLKFHQSGFANIANGETCLILDIDWMIIDNIDELLSIDIGERFGCFHRWWSNLTHKCRINGGLQMFRMGTTNYLYEEFMKKPEYWQEYYIRNGLASGPVNGEQNFIDEHVTHERLWLPEKWFAKYNDEEYTKIQRNWHNKVNSDEPYFLGGEFHEDIKMVHFSNADNMIHNYDWTEEFW